MASAFPTEISQEDLWDGFFAEHYGEDRRAERIWRSCGVRSRHGAIVPFKEDARDWGTGERMGRFVEEALPLGLDAVRRCLDTAGVPPAAIDVLASVSCTGYATPGLDVLVAKDLLMNPQVQRVNVGHMGCHAALPALAAVADAAVARQRKGVLVSVELGSLHIQPPDREVDQVVSHALFSDAAAALTVLPYGPGLEVLDFRAQTAPDTEGLMRWEITDHGFRMTLSPAVPRVLRQHLSSLVLGLLETHGLAMTDVAGWALHPGGPRILEVAGQELGLGEDQVEDSRKVLRDHGNCSSATVLLILQQLLAGGAINNGDYVVALAFGPGLTLYSALFRKRG